MREAAERALNVLGVDTQEIGDAVGRADAVVGRLSEEWMKSIVGLVEVEEKLRAQREVAEEMEGRYGVLVGVCLPG